MSTILVPLDTSPLAEAVLPHVRRLAAMLGARVHLLHVIEAEGQIVLGKGASGGSLDERGRYLNEQAVSLRAADIETTTEVWLGRPAQAILERAAAQGASMIAMASHGYSGLRRWTLGSVADKVVHAAQVPVFLVRAAGGAAPPAGQLGRILVPLDGSDLSRGAITPAAEIAARAGADMLLLTAMEPAADTYALVAHKDLHRALEELLELERQRLAADPRLAGRAITTAVVEGFAADAIVEAAARYRADLIVMATHGRSGLGRWALGSVADKVLHAAAVPLLLVRVPSAVEQLARAAAA